MRSRIRFFALACALLTSVGNGRCGETTSRKNEKSEFNEELMGARGFARAVVLPHVDFRDSPLSEVLDFLRSKAGRVRPDGMEMNIVFKPRATREERGITGDAKDIRLDKLIEMVAHQEGYAVRWDGYAAVVETRVSRRPEIRTTNARSKKDIETVGRLWRLVLPSVKINHQPLREVLKYLSEESLKASPELGGVPFELKLPAGDDGPKITLRLDHVVLAEAIRYAAELSGSTLSVNGEKVEFRLKDKRRISSERSR